MSLSFAERAGRELLPGTDRRIGLRWLAGAAALAAAVALGPRALWPLLWPALSLTAVAAAYLRQGAPFFGKRDGRHPAWARLLLAPYFLLVRTWHTGCARGIDPWSEIAPGVWIGRCPGREEARSLVREGEAAVLDLAVERSAPPAFADAVYLQVPMLDLAAPPQEDLDRAVEFVRRHAPGRAAGPRNAGAGANDGGAADSLRRVYIHCALGRSRSALVAAAWLVAEDPSLPAEEALDRVRRRRPGIVLTRPMTAALETYRRRVVSARGAPPPERPRGPMSSRCFSPGAAPGAFGKEKEGGTCAHSTP